MNKEFGELTKSMAQFIAPRSALRKFGLGLAGMVLAISIPLPTITFASCVPTTSPRSIDLRPAWS